MTARFVNPLPQFADANGNPLSGGTLEFYVSGTSTPQNTFSEAGLATANPNPLSLDSDGRPANPVFLDSKDYKVVLKSSDGTVIWTEDPVRPSGLPAIQVSTLSDLQGLGVSSRADGSIAYMAGRTSVGDGAEGTFCWDGSDLSTEVSNDEVTANEGDGGIYVAPSSDKTGASGAWVRQRHKGEFWATWYGLNKSASDNQPALKAVLYAAKRLGGGTVHIPFDNAATYTMDSTLVWPAGSVSLNGHRPTTSATVGGGLSFTQSGFNNGVVLDATGTDDDGDAYNSPDDAPDIRNIRIVGNNSAGSGLYVKGVRDVTGYGILAQNWGGDGVRLVNVFGAHLDVVNTLDNGGHGVNLKISNECRVTGRSQRNAGGNVRIDGTENDVDMDISTLSDEFTHPWTIEGDGNRIAGWVEGVGLGGHIISGEKNEIAVHHGQFYPVRDNGHGTIFLSDNSPRLPRGADPSQLYDEIKTTIPNGDSARDTVMFGTTQAGVAATIDPTTGVSHGRSAKITYDAGLTSGTALVQNGIQSVSSGDWVLVQFQAKASREVYGPYHDGSAQTKQEAVSFRTVGSTLGSKFGLHLTTDWQQFSFLSQSDSSFSNATLIGFEANSVDGTNLEVWVDNLMVVERPPLLNAELPFISRDRGTAGDQSAIRSHGPIVLALELADDETFEVPLPAGAHGLLSAVVNTGIAISVGFTQGTGLNELASTSNASATDTDGNLCVFADGSSNVVVKNRRGNTRVVHLTYSYTES